MLRSVPFVAMLSLAVVLGACGSGGSSGDSTVSSVVPPSTIGGVGVVPAAASADRAPTIMLRPPVNVDGSTAELVGMSAEGNRVLLLGDSILASTSSRYGNQMCAALVPLGWRVDVEAEPSRFVEFGNKVLDKVLRANAAPADDWNAAVIFLGSNYRGDPLAYEAELRKMIDRLSPRPILLLTVTVYRPDWAEVNDVVHRLGEEYDNVTVLDWQAISEYPGVLSGDRLHPTDTGRQVLAEAVAGALGEISVGQGECLRSEFRDDSAVSGKPDNVLGTPSPNSGGSSGGDSSGGSSGGGWTPSTTVPRPGVTTTTVNRGTPTTTAPGSGGGVTTTTTPSGGGQPPTTPPVTTNPPATSAPPTSASPTTTPPQPQPPTSPPPVGQDGAHSSGGVG